MKEININNEIYVLKSDADKAINEEKDKSIARYIQERKLHIDNPQVIDRAHVICLATVTLTDSYLVSNFSIDYLKKAISIIEAIDDENLHIAIGKDLPLCLGSYKNGKMTGVILAPRVDN
jgi:hypothetical protein